ncbi:MAG TPA: hypothetical protein HA250_01605 [Nanoarchaeota archaeon]|nr:hypothetical protein [Nanoarchaeota archaeon]
MKLNKRAISPLIATVIIIAITVAAGIVLYAMVWPLINKPITQTICTEVTFELDPESSCVSLVGGGFPSGTNEVKVSINRIQSPTDEPVIAAWKVIVDAGEGERRSSDETWSIPSGEQRTNTLSVDNAKLTALKGNVIGVSIYPVINVRNTQVACEALTRTLDRLRSCA